MEIIQKTIKYYVHKLGNVPFKKWFHSLKDIKGQQVILSRLTRIERGNMGDCEPVGQGVNELRIHFGPGYRVYFGFDGKTVVILLIGGDKKTQNKDIETAHLYWKDYLRRKEQ